jgi:hypothetical protein
MSKSKRRSLAAIGNSRVIPGERSETRDPICNATLGPGFRRDYGDCVA